MTKKEQEPITQIQREAITACDLVVLSGEMLVLKKINHRVFG